MATTGKVWQVERPCPVCGRAYVPKLKKQKTCGDRACIVKRQRGDKEITERPLCVYCKKNRINRKSWKFCSKDCAGKWRVEQSKKAKPPKFTHCQNPNCGLALTHMRKKGNGWYYDPNTMYCNVNCMGQHLAVKVKEGNPCRNLYQYMDGKNPKSPEVYVPRRLDGNLNIPELVVLYD